MSGIVGIFHRDGAPVEQPLLRALTQFLAYRGPDVRDAWSDGLVGFGHTLLRTAPEASVSERQPMSLEGRYWIVADARLDSHAELEAELDSAERRVPSDAGDAELILHAYAAWGEDCVRHLRGDFAFAIWDSRRRTLFCARDHFGIKPFYYAHLGEMFLFSNTLDCVRLYPGVSDELNDAAIADFLFFGLNCDVATTTFRDIQRLPAAHSLTVSAGGMRIERYWSAPTDGCIRYRRDEDYVEHFLLLMGAAVTDRIRTDRAGIWLSGGMDSSTVAAMAREASEAGGAPELRAYTVSVEGLMRDEESLLAGQVADFLHIPIRVIPMKDRDPFAGWDRFETTPTEPVENPFVAGFYDEFEGSHFLGVRPFPWKGIQQRALRLAGRADVSGAGSASDTAFAFEAGGGVDVNVTPRIAIRVGEFDYEDSKLYGSIGIGAQDDYKYKAAILFRF